MILQQTQPIKIQTIHQMIPIELFPSFTLPRNIGWLGKQNIKINKIVVDIISTFNYVFEVFFNLQFFKKRPARV